MRVCAIAVRRDTHPIIEHIPRLRRYARALTGDVFRADDLVQDTLERAWSRFGLWRRGSDLRAWLFTIMHNVYVNHCAARRESAIGTPLEEDLDGLPLTPSPEHALGLRELAQSLNRLPAEYREVLLLVGLEGFRYEEAAEVLGVPVGTVMSRLSRARERLRRMMERESSHCVRRVK